MVASSEADLTRFIEAHPTGVIVKPIGLSGGRGVFLIQGPKSPNLRVILESVTEDFTRHVIAQTYLPQVQQGDKRILTLGQKFLGVFLRKPAKGEHRANLHSGGTLHPGKLDKRDRQILTVLQPKLDELGLDFVGLDVIGGFLTEINITSPMGIAEMRDTGNPGGERLILDFIERRIQ